MDRDVIGPSAEIEIFVGNPLQPVTNKFSLHAHSETLKSKMFLHPIVDKLGLTNAWHTTISETQTKLAEKLIVTCGKSKNSLTISTSLSDHTLASNIVNEVCNRAVTFKHWCSEGTSEMPNIPMDSESKDWRLPANTKREEVRMVVTGKSNKC